MMYEPYFNDLVKYVYNGFEYSVVVCPGIPCCFDTVSWCIRKGISAECHFSYSVAN